MSSACINELQLTDKIIVFTPFVGVILTNTIVCKSYEPLCFDLHVRLLNQAENAKWSGHVHRIKMSQTCKHRYRYAIAQD